MSRDRRWVDPYAGIAGRRLFVAVSLPADAAETIAEVVGMVRDQPLPEGARDVRWVRLDGLHLTLRFLGPTAPEAIDPTLAAVDRSAGSTAPINAVLSGAGTFPPTGRPRALWVGVGAGADALGTLATTVGRELVAAGWPADARPFSPHLTLARADGVPVGRLVADRLAAAMRDRHIDVSLRRIGLFESVTGGGPARYLPVQEFDLAGPDPGPAVYHRDHP